MDLKTLVTNNTVIRLMRQYSNEIMDITDMLEAGDIAEEDANELAQDIDNRYLQRIKNECR